MAWKNAIEWLKRFFASFRRDWGLKLVSLLFAVILWNYVVMVLDPMTSLTVIVDAQYPNSTQLKNSNLTISADSANALKGKTVAVTLDMKRSVALRLNKSLVQVTADLSNITSEGTADVTFKASVPPDCTVKEISPSSIPVTIERRDSLAVPVAIKKTGALPSGYLLYDLQLDSKVLNIYGASANIDRVAQAVVTLDLTSVSTSSINFSRALKYTLLDSSGNALDPAGLEFDKQNCIVSASVLQVKSVPVDTSRATNGILAKGYAVTKIEVEPVTVDIAGSADALSGVTSLQLISSVSVESANSNVSAPLKVLLPPNTIAINGDTVWVYVTITQKMTEVTIPDVPISIQADAGMKIDDKYTATVTVTCPELTAKLVKASGIHLFADATGMAAGPTTLKIRWEADADLDVASVILNPVTVTVTLVPKATPTPTPTASVKPT